MIILFAVVIILVSRESHTVYFYSRVPLAMQVEEVSWPIKSRVMTRKVVAQKKTISSCELAHQVTVMIPSRPHEESKVGEEVVCDPCFFTAIKIALGGTAELKVNVLKMCADHWNTVGPRKVTKVNKQFI